VNLKHFQYWENPEKMMRHNNPYWGSASTLIGALPQQKKLPALPEKMM
jgi:hypothetical protein